MMECESAKWRSKAVNMAEPTSTLDQEPSCISSSAVDEHGVGTASGDLDAESRAFCDALRSLPSEAVQELLYLGICSHCVIRLFGITEPAEPSTFSLPTLLCQYFGTSIKPQGNAVDAAIGEDEGLENRPTSEGSDSKAVICSICLGILQFFCDTDKKLYIKKGSPSDLAGTIAELVKQEDYHIANFSLEIAIPSVTLENERKVWFYLKEKYGSHVWFQERSITQCISLKDALKSLIVSPVEKILAVKCGKDDFTIRLTYTAPSKRIEDLNHRDPVAKKIKTGATNGLDTVDESMDASAGSPASRTKEENPVTQKSLNGLPDILLNKVIEPCSLSLKCSRAPIYFSGRYFKYSRNVSQSCWMIDEERKGEASVEEIIGNSINPACLGEKYKFHAAGREDIDVRMLGSGRPFLIEIQNARHIPSEESVKKIEEKINNVDGKLVSVKNLNVVGSDVWARMREGETEKQKQYVALVWISRPLEDEDLKTVSSFNDLVVLQRTPIRVLHRRSPLDREKIIHWMKIDPIADSSHYFLLHLCTQAGTYIKEFVHGDLGRTHPNIGSILQCRAEILQLDVTDVKMDSF